VTLDGAGLVVAGGADAGERGSVETAAAALRLRGSSVRSSGDGLAQEVWETVLAEVRGRLGGRLDLSVGDPAGNPPALSVSSVGHVGVGTATPARPLDVAGGAVVSGPLTVGDLLRASAVPATTRAAFHLAVGAGGETPVLRLHGGADSTGPALVSLTSAGALTVGAAGTRVLVQDDLSVRGVLFVTNPSGGSVSIGGRAFDNEGEFSPNNLKVVMANRILPPHRDRPFQFMVGYGRQRFVLGDGGLAHRFIRVLSVDDKGNAFFAAGKGGYVFDYVVNAAGGPLERGDVVVLRRSAPVACLRHVRSHPHPRGRPHRRGVRRPGLRRRRRCRARSRPDGHRHGGGRKRGVRPRPLSGPVRRTGGGLRRRDGRRPADGAHGDAGLLDHCKANADSAGGGR
jgi:hypothetical protein